MKALWLVPVVLHCATRWSNKREETMPTWPVRDAKARFSAMLDACITTGPQIITRRHIEAAVLVHVDEWHRLQPAPRPSLKQLLLTEEARFSPVLPRRGKQRRRPPVAAR